MLVESFLGASLRLEKLRVDGGSGLGPQNTAQQFCSVGLEGVEVLRRGTGTPIDTRSAIINLKDP